MDQDNSSNGREPRQPRRLQPVPPAAIDPRGAPMTLGRIIAQTALIADSALARSRTTAGEEKAGALPHGRRSRFGWFL